MTTVAPPVALSSPVLAWLSAPSSERGADFADGEDGWERFAWSALADRAWRVAGGLIDAGVTRGDVVAIVGDASAAFVAGLFGAMLAGAVPAPCPPPLLFGDPAAYEAHLIGKLLSAEAAWLLAGPNLEPVLSRLARRVGVPMLGLADLQRAAAVALPRRPVEHALLQFTSGSSGRPRPIPVSFAALGANVEAIRGWLGIRPQDSVTAWLPVHHDMGLVGCLITPAAAGSQLQLMSPEQYVRSPLRYLRCFHDGRSQLSAMPAFGLGQILRRVRPEMVAGLDLSDWRTLIVGAERLDADLMRRFEDLLAPAGFSPRTLRPAYGLAEATLAVTGVSTEARWRHVVTTSQAAVGDRIDASASASASESAAGPRQCVVGCGRPLAGVTVRIADEAGRPLPDGRLGEIVVDGPWSEMGLYTGDAGFLDGGELFVLGRLGDGLKISGRFVFAEDIESELAAVGLPKWRVAVLLGHDGSNATAVAVLESPADDAEVATATAVLRRRAAGARVLAITVPRGTIPRTTSGKPRRRALWNAFIMRQLPPTIPAARRTAQPKERGHA
jgi:acyl-CoA synthetase (AMP-forming)/AMP-acid ligase II